MKRRKTRLHILLVLVFCLAPQPQRLAASHGDPSVSIVVPGRADFPERLAAREVRRYWYVRTRRFEPLLSDQSQWPPDGPLVVLGTKNRPAVQSLAQADSMLAASVASLRSQQYRLKTIEHNGRKAVLIAGGDPIGTLYGAYRFAEALGVRFYLHGDVVPDNRMEPRLPDIDERGAPLFTTRGIQPFHDFPEGPDWWSTDGYKAILAQLPKLKMNFFGLHTYPEGGVGPEPTVWIGLRDDVNPDGTVRFSSVSSYDNTLRGNWGYAAKKTGDFSFGTAQLFEQDAYGPDVMAGAFPFPETLDERNAVFNNVGKMLKKAFTFAHALGVETCVGTETPLTIPTVVKERIKARGQDPNDPAVVQEVYEGMFHRISKAYPVDYYWFWTPEHWTWGDPKDEEVQATVTDLEAAIAAAGEVNAPFTLATCGWVLGPPSDRALFDNLLPKEMPMSCINRNVGFAPVEVGFARVKDRPQWAIPWLEDDPALIIPQLWVGRMRRDAADALAYGGDGLLGIHWRTRPLAPNVSALAKAAWDQTSWNPHLDEPFVPVDPETIEGREGGSTANFPNNPIADTQRDPLYQTVTYNVKAYRLKLPNGAYTVRLQFCEPHYSEAGKRVFGVTLQGKLVIDRLDVFATVGRNRALDYTFPGVTVSNGMLEIGFKSIVEYPCIAAFVVQGQGASRKINCGGPAYEDYDADLADTGIDDRPRDLPAGDFYRDWTTTQFGAAVAKPLAALFTKLDGGPNMALRGHGTANLPRPSTWVHGPGGIRPDDRPWDQVRDDYAFVDQMAAWRPDVKGAGNLERFDYWLNTFRYLRTVGRVNCIWARFNAAMEQIKKVEDRDRQKRLAHRTALPIRRELIRQVEKIHELLLATITTTGGMGTIANWQQHLLPSLLTEPGDELAALLGTKLPAAAKPTSRSAAPPRIIVPTVRSVLTTGEDLRLKIILLNVNEPDTAELHWRPLGRRDFASIPVRHVARSVYEVTLPTAKLNGRDFEYYVEAEAPDHGTLVFPATAPQLNQTVVVAHAH